MCRFYFDICWLLKNARKLDSRFIINCSYDQIYVLKIRSYTHKNKKKYSVPIIFSNLCG